MGIMLRRGVIGAGFFGLLVACGGAFGPSTTTNALIDDAACPELRGGSMSASFAADASANATIRAFVLASGDLTAWQRQGVMLLNRVLTVCPGAPASHRGHGWEQFTEHAIRALVARGGPLVAVLWGRDAQGLAPLLGDVPRIESAHPSPLSASRGFFGSRPFSRANALLAEQGAQPIRWAIP